MPPRKIFMGSTEVPASKSALSIMSLLAAAGARSVNMRYDEDRRLAGIDFVFAAAGGAELLFPFSIPARIDLLFDRMWKQRVGRRPPAKDVVKAQAERVAWRQLFRWVEAQVALVDTGMVTHIEVFTPYCVDRSGRTMFEVMMTSRLKELRAGPSGGGE